MGMTVYLISYYDRVLCCRTYYMNRSSWETPGGAEREIVLLKRREDKNKRDIGYRKWIRFKVESKEIRKNQKIKIK